jgi:diguanylate cyclase (GGDEF)-like protein/PAS domain S-box-containing protein
MQMAGYKRVRGRDVQVLGLDPPQVQAAQREQMDRLKRAVEQNADAVYITDPTGRIEYVNPAFEALTGFSRAEAVGRHAAFLNADGPGLQAWRGAQLQAAKTFSAVVVQRRKQGETFHAEINIRPFVDMLGSITHFVATGHDVSTRIKAMRRLEHLAHHDYLTGLPNRTLFEDRVQRALVHAVRHGEGFALMYLDVDQFKPVNDRQGHAAGDRLLQEVATCLRNSVREEDTVARLGGDEFVVIATQVGCRGSARKVLDKILAAFRGETVLPGGRLPLSVSIGVAIYPRDGDDDSALLRHADQAMYGAKAAGGNGYCFFEPGRAPIQVPRVASIGA